MTKKQCVYELNGNFSGEFETQTARKRNVLKFVCETKKLATAAVLFFFGRNSIATLPHLLHLNENDNKTFRCDFILADAMDFVSSMEMINGRNLVAIR